MRTCATALLLCLFAVSAPTAGDVFDGFEDGDYTSDPPWTVMNPEDGDSAVVADPTRPDNLVASGYGTEGHERVLQTPVTMDWAGFHLSSEILCLHNNEFGPAWFLRRGDDHYADPYYSININVHKEPEMTNVQLRIDEYCCDHPDFVRHNLYFEADPVGNWWRLDAWHDEIADQVIVELRSIADDSLIFDYSFTPVVDLATEPAFAWLKIGFGEPSWSYMDNVRLTRICVGCPGDLSHDCYRDVTDFSIFAGAYGSQVGDPNYLPEADLWPDGYINVTDFTIFAGYYLVPCP